jgi:hypothetical protein
MRMNKAKRPVSIPEAAAHTRCHSRVRNDPATNAQFKRLGRREEKNQIPTHPVVNKRIQPRPNVQI